MTHSIITAEAVEGKATTSYNQIRTCDTMSILLGQGKDGRKRCFKFSSCLPSLLRFSSRARAPWRGSGDDGDWISEMASKSMPVAPGGWQARGGGPGQPEETSHAPPRPRWRPRSGDSSCASRAGCHAPLRAPPPTPEASLRTLRERPYGL